MEVTVTKLTDIDLCKEMLQFVYGIEKSTMGLDQLYFEGHSIERTQLYVIWMKDIYNKVSMQLRTCAGAGQFHLISSHRADWNHEEGDTMSPTDWDESFNRLSLHNHVMILNATHLKTMSHLRLCAQAEQDTQVVMNAIRDAVSQVDPHMAANMMPECQHRGGICTHGKKSCGYNLQFLKNMVSHIPEHIYRDARNELAVLKASGKVNIQ